MSEDEALADLHLARAAAAYVRSEIAEGREGRATLNAAEWHVHRTLEAWNCVRPVVAASDERGRTWPDPTGDEATATVMQRTSRGSLRPTRIEAVSSA